MWPFKKKKKKTEGDIPTKASAQPKAVNVSHTEDAHDPTAVHVRPTFEETVTGQETVRHPVEPPVKKQPVEARLRDEQDNGDASASKNKPQRYHVSQNKDESSEFFKQWRVRKEGSDKTIKYFRTQKEAIAHAEKLAENAGSSIVIHKVDGSWRKQDYRKK